MADVSRIKEEEPTSAEILAYFIGLVGIEKLEPALALMDPLEVLEVRRLAATRIKPERALIIGAALARKLDDDRAHSDREPSSLPALFEWRL